MICITKGEQEKPLINFSIPLGILKFGAQFIPKNAQFNASGSSVDLSTINWQQVIDLAASGEKGDILNLEINDDGDRLMINIYVE